MGKPWLKLWTDTLSDRKLRRLKPAEKWCWVGLLLLAAETDDAGKIELADGVPMMADDFIDALDVEPETWESAYAYFLRLGMITVDGDGFVVVVNYAKRQEPKDPTAADRMRRYRDKSRTSKEVTADVTRNVTAMLRVEEEVEAEAETTTAASEFAALHRFWCDTTTRAGGGDTVSLQAVFDEWKDQIDSQGIRAAIVKAAQAKGMAATPAYLAGVLRNQAKAAKSGNGTLKMYIEAEQ